MAKRSERPFVAYDGSERLRRYQTRYWLDGRKVEPLRSSKGFPKTEDGSLEGVGRLALKGYIAKAQCFDWVEGKVLWTVRRGAKVPGTNIYTVHIVKGDDNPFMERKHA